MDAPVPPVPQPPKSSSAPTAFVGAATGRVPWHRSHDIFVFRDRIILTKVGRQSYVPSSTRKRLAQDSRLTAGMLAMRKKARVLHLSAVNDVDVWRKPTGGRATFMLSNGSHVDFDWLSLRNTRDPEDLINKVLSDRVDRVEPSISAFVGGVVARLAFAVAVLAAFVAAAVGGAFGVSALLDDGPPAPPPPPPPTTLPANVQTARAELAKVCPGWLAFENRRGLGDRPAPGELKAVIDGMRGPFDAAAAADASYVVARDQVAWLQDYAGRPDDVAVREAAARVRFALNSVDAACRGL
jgi:hypothetical protein